MGVINTDLKISFLNFVACGHRLEVHFWDC